MTGEDGLHQRIAGLGAGDHVPDLLIDAAGLAQPAFTAACVTAE
jgi:hypothetical protein